VDEDEDEEEEEDLIFEELLLVLTEDRAPAASVEVATNFTNAIIKTKRCPKRAILDRLRRKYASTIKAGGNVQFGGFETVTDAMNRKAFQPLVFDASWGEHKFGYHFPTRWGAAAAHDIFVRVLQS
jgi:hypothetical protein